MRPALRAIAGGGIPQGEAARVTSRGVALPAGPRGGVAACPRARADRSRRLVASALSTAGAWFVEPAEHSPEAPVAVPAGTRSVVAVFGLAPGCGATVVARALAAELAARDASGTAAVACEARTSGIPLATQAASRLARALEDLPGAATRAVGRLCLIEGADQLTLAESSRHVAPLVLDAGSASLGGAPASVADRAVVVANPAVEPALARVAAECLARVGAESIVVLNRARPGGHPAGPAGEGSAGEIDGAGGRSVDRWHVVMHDDDPALTFGEPGFMEPGSLRLPDSRLGARLALGGREARGDLGRAIARLADCCELWAS